LITFNLYKKSTTAIPLAIDERSDI
jgi:hypothetical protein